VETLVARSSSHSSDLSALSGVAPELAAAFASLTGDLALVIDPKGVIREVAIAGSSMGHPADDWVGRSWAETVTGDTRRKIELLLEEASDPGVTRRREVNHPSNGGADIPMSYAALRLGLDGPVIAVGRDLRAVAAIQQRFVDAQREMERDYWRLRQEGSRQRLLAQVATDALMVIDGATLAVHDINAAGESMFGPQGAPLPLPVKELLAKVLRTGRPEEVRTRLHASAGAAQIDMCAMPFRAQSEDMAPHGLLQLLVRARSAAADGTGLDGEAVVVTDSNGHVLVANAAFRALCRSDADHVEGLGLCELLGDPQRHLAAVLADARRGGLVRRPALLLGGGRSPTFECFAQAALMNDGDQECVGIMLVPAKPLQADSLRAALLALLDQTGELPLRELVRRAAELTERHAVETALRRTADGRGDTAFVLGLSEADLAERMARLGLTR
jgi:transcriptional regulator PpsR